MAGLDPVFCVQAEEGVMLLCDQHSWTARQILQGRFVVSRVTKVVRLVRADAYP